MNLSRQDEIPDLPILTNKLYAKPSVFTPENLLREARRQKGLEQGAVPAICVLDPDGDLVDYLNAMGLAKRHKSWACYHTNLDTFLDMDLGVEFGIIGRVVGAPFAVLVAEELFASGCQFLISLTSAGQISPAGQPPYLVLIDKALRDEGTSYHYLPPSSYSYLNPELRTVIEVGWDETVMPLRVGPTWTTDAPFRETEEAISFCNEQGILTVEMEAAGLYALGTAKSRNIICFAHVTNQMGQTEGDFEKGLHQGSLTALQLLNQVAKLFNPVYLR